MNRRLDTSQVEFSRFDDKINIKIPQFLDKNVAKLDGIIRSDGSVFYGNDHHNDLIIYGHYVNDLPYLLFQVIPLIKKVHGPVPIKIHKYPTSGKCIRMEIHSKAIASFWSKVMLVPNNKQNFELFSPILTDEKFITLNLASYFDGDGCICFSPGTRRYSSSKTKINYYPLIDWTTESANAAEKIKHILINLGFNPFICKHTEEKGGRTRHTVRVSGRYSYEKFLSIFDLNNPKHLTKILIYEIHGFCPPNTTLIDRIKILRGELTPESFYNNKIQKIRPITMKENEEKVLQVLYEGSTYYSEIMRKSGLNTCAVLPRLMKFGQVKCLGIRSISHTNSGKFYEITDIGRKRLKRISRIKEKLQTQFNLKF